MSVAFDAAFEWILEAEGVDSDDPADPGGRTRYGISQASHPGVDVEHLTREQAREIYLREYWQPIGGDSLSPPVALVLFDTAVNHGLTRALRMRNQADVLGQNTVRAILAFRAHLYVDLVLRNPEQIKFLKGWIARLLRLRTRALALEVRP
jgi:lysozyme family protein